MINHVFFSDGQFESIRRRAQTDAHVRTLTELVLNDAKHTDDIGALAFAYYYNGDEDCAVRAHRRMIALLDDPRWENSDFTSTDLHTAALCEQMAVAYSLFADVIDQEDRRHLALETWKRGIAPILREWTAPGYKVHAIDTMGHNWWPVCVSSGAFAAVVMLEDLLAWGVQEAKDLLQTAVDGLAAWFAYQGNPMNAKPPSFDRGAFYEGVTYTDYLLHEYLEFAIAYRAIMGRHPFDDTPYLTACADFLVHTSYVSDKGARDYYLNFGDADGFGYLHAPLHLLAYGIDHDGLRWLARQYSDQNAAALLRLRTYEAVYDQPAAPPEETSVCYDRIGWAVFRDGWEKNSTMLAVKCGDTWNHAHADAAHFVLYRNGACEIFDSGSPVSYSNPKYIPYYTDSIAHNTVLFEGRGQDFRDNYKNHAHNIGRLYNFVDKPGFRYVAADATGPMSRYFRKHHRHFVWV
ncbi:MAG: heparinase II/III family protein, partial [Clostridia bacterium]|nr:heparinase II/III family protein [Clostridia bacterium]